MLSLGLTSAGTLYIITKLSVLILAILLTWYVTASNHDTPETSHALAPDRALGHPSGA